MSLNHLIQNGLQTKKINIVVESIQAEGPSLIKTKDGGTYNLQTDTIGTPGQVLKTDSLGGTYWANDTAGISGITYSGPIPVPLGTHTKSSNTLGTQHSLSLVTEVDSNLNLNGLDLETQGGLVNNMAISGGIIESQGLDQLQLASKIGDIKMLDNIDMGNNKITNLSPPVDPTDAVTKSYTDSLAGVTFNGTLPCQIGQHMKFNDVTGITCNKSSIVETATDLNIGSLKLTNMTDPTTNQGGATKNYVDSQISNLPIPVQNVVGGNENEICIYTDRNGHLIKKSNVVISDDNINVNYKRVVNMANPVNTNDAVTKNYVDSQIVNLPTPVQNVTGAAENEVCIYTDRNGDRIKQSGVFINTDVDVNNKRMINLAPPVNANDAVNKSYADGYYLYNGLTDSAVVQSEEQSILTTTGIGNLTLSDLEAGQTYNLNLTGQINNPQSDELIEIKLIGGIYEILTLCRLYVKTENNGTEPQYFNLDAEITIRNNAVSGSIITTSNFSFNKSQTLQNVRGVQVTTLNTTNGIPLNIMAKVDKDPERTSTPPPLDTSMIPPHILAMLSPNELQPIGITTIMTSIQTNTARLKRVY